MTKEQELISSNNCEKAKQYFNLQKGYVLHHKDTTLRHNDIERYIQWNPEDLVVMKNGEHSSYHWSLDKEERSKKISEALKGIDHKGNKNPMYGKSQTLETRKKISEKLQGNEPANKGCHWYTNGEINIMKKECPSGFWKGVTKHEMVG